MIGKFPGKIVDYGLSKTQTGKPQAVVQFSVEHEGQSRTVTWYGTLAPDNSGDRKGITITLKALAAMGMTQDNVRRLSTDFTEGPKTGILDMTKELSLDLQEETIQGDNGQPKTVTRVQWVNDPADTYVIKKLTAAESVQVMGGLDFSGDFYKIMQDKGGKSGGQGQGGQGQGQNQNQNYNQGNQGQNYNQNQNQNQNYNQNQNQNGGGYQNQGQNQNYNNGGQNQNYNNGQGQGGQQNNQGQNGQGGNGFKAPF